MDINIFVHHFLIQKFLSLNGRLPTIILNIGHPEMLNERDLASEIESVV